MTWGHTSGHHSPPTETIAMLGAAGNTPGANAIVFQTLAAVSLVPGPIGPDATYAFVVETHSFYLWIPGDTSTIDGVLVLGPGAGGGAGRWVHEGDTIVLTPLGGGADDAAHVMVSIAPAAAYKRKIVLQPDPDTGAVFTWASLRGTPSGTHLECDPGVTINATIVPSGAPLDAIFFGAPVTTSATVLAAPIVLGSNQFLAVKPFTVAIGDYVRSDELNLVHRVSIYRVIDVADAGANVLITVERPILYQYLAAPDVMENVLPPIDIVLNGNGAKLRGTASSYIFFDGMLDSQVMNWDMTDASGLSQFACGFGFGSWNSQMTDIDADALTGSASGGLALKSCEGCEIIDSIASRFSVANVFMHDCINCIVRATSGTGGIATGCLMTSIHTPEQGCLGCLIDACDFDANLVGVQLTAGTARCTVRDTSVQFSVTHGIDISGGAADLSDNLITGCCADSSLTAVNVGSQSLRTTIEDLTGNTSGRGLVVATGARKTVLDTAALDGCTINMMVLLGPVDARKIRGDFPVPAGKAVLINAGSDGSTFDGFECHATAEVFEQGATADKWKLRNAKLTVDAGGTAILMNSNGAGVLDIDESSIAQNGGAATGIVIGAAKTLRMGDRVELLGLGTPFFINALGFCNRGGTVLLNAGAPKAVPWPDLQPSDDVLFSVAIVAGAGAVGQLPVLTKTPGTGFSVQGAVATDVSTFDYVIR